MRCLFIIDQWAMDRPVDLSCAWASPRGLTGSETSIMMSAREFARLGHDVFLAGRFTGAAEWEGVKVCGSDEEYSTWRDAPWDIVFSWLDPHPLAEFPNARLRVLNQQVNDFDYCRAGWTDHVDIITSPSKTHRDYLQTVLPSFARDRWLVWHNAVDVETYRPGPFCERPRMVFASSADRALHWVLEMYPRIRSVVPTVTLDIYYPFRELYERLKRGEHEMATRIRYCAAMLDRLKAHGVTMHDAVSKDDLRRAMRESRLLVYPCEPVRFTEGFSVTTAEAAALGCLPVLAGADALPELYGTHCPMVAAPYHLRKDEYIAHVVELLADDAYYATLRTRATELGDRFSVQRTTASFLADLAKLTEPRIAA